MNWVKQAAAYAGSRAQLARELGVSKQAVHFWEAELRTPEPAICSLVLKKYGIPRWKTRPKDWADIWPEEVGAKGAPKVKAAA